MESLPEIQAFFSNFKHLVMVHQKTQQQQQFLNRQNLLCSVGLPKWLSGKESACQMQETQEMWLDPWVRKDTPGEGNYNPLQYPCIEFSTGRGTWQAPVHGGAKSQRQLSTYAQQSTTVLCIQSITYPLEENS